MPSSRVSADGLVTALNPVTNQLQVYSAADGSIEQTQDLTPLPVLTGGAASISNQVDDSGELVTIAGVAYALEAKTGAQLWSLSGASRPTTQYANPYVITDRGISQLDSATGTATSTSAIAAPPAGSIAYKLGSGFVVSGSSTTVYR